MGDCLADAAAVVEGTLPKPATPGDFGPLEQAAASEPNASRAMTIFPGR
jgi:hypothetical protein